MSINLEQLNRRQRRHLCLAASVQGLLVVRQWATTGQCNRDARRALLRVIYASNPDNWEQMLGSIDDWQPGIGELREWLHGGPKPHLAESMRHAIQVLKLADQLRNNATAQQCVASKLATVDAETAFADDDLDPLANAAADAFRTCVSPLASQIMVHGKGGHLENLRVAGEVRAALLASVRMAWAWQGQGGRRWHLALRRRELADDLAAFAQA